MTDAGTVNLWLVSYGRQLFESGRRYWHHSETINGLAARKPILKRSLQAAWDLAFSWMALEPTRHHVAMPAVILLGMLTTCLLWGWVKEAGLFALSWGGLLRIGEATSMGCALLPAAHLGQDRGTEDSDEDGAPPSGARGAV